MSTEKPASQRFADLSGHETHPEPKNSIDHPIFRVPMVPVEGDRIDNVRAVRIRYAETRNRLYLANRSGSERMYEVITNSRRMSLDAMIRMVGYAALAHGLADNRGSAKTESFPLFDRTFFVQGRSMMDMVLDFVWYAVDHVHTLNPEHAASSRLVAWYPEFLQASRLTNRLVVSAPDYAALEGVQP